MEQTQFPQRVNNREEDRVASEEVFIEKVKREYEETIGKYSEDSKPIRISNISSALGIFSTRLKSTPGFVYSEKQQSILQLKLARHFQRYDDLDVDTLYEALVSSPDFINKDKGHLNKAIEVYEQKKLIRIAEMRKMKTVETSGINPK